MKVLVFGAGVIGTIYGQALSECGTEITHYVRPDKLERLQNGLELQLLDGRKSVRSISRQYKPNLVTELPSLDYFDLLLISVKHYQLESILPMISESMGRADILFFNHLWSDTTVINKYIPKDKYLLGFPNAGGGFYETPDLVLKGALLKQVYLGELNGKRTSRLQSITTMFEQAHIQVDIPNNILHWLWKQFSLNAAISTMTMKTGGAEALISNLSNLHEAVYCIREALSVCQARGVELRSFSDARAFFLPSWIAALGFWFTLKSNKPQSEIFKKYNCVEEIQYVYNDLIKTAAELQVSVPRLNSMNSYICDLHRRPPKHPKRQEGIQER